MTSYTVTLRAGKALTVLEQISQTFVPLYV